MQTDFDTIILGGGCAGLSLGTCLAQRTDGLHRTLILESRDKYDNDRTWCFWRHHAHRWDHIVTRNWSRVMVSEGVRDVVIDCQSTPYQMIEAIAFYEEARRIIAASNGVQLRMGTCVVDTPVYADGRWQVRTANDLIGVRHIIDTRPPRTPQAGDALLWQSFLGEEIRCNSSVFDTQAVVLMHFAEPDSATDTQGVMFTYVLPFSAHHALIETTVFGAQPLLVADLRAHQQRAVAKWTRGGAYELVRTESGILPMGLSATEEYVLPGYVRVGLMHGAARPSTGYAFQRIQRWADLCARSLINGHGPTGHAPDSMLLGAMDLLFLKVIRDDPGRAPSLFVDLFAKASAARLIRFLSDEATMVDCAAIVTALPASPFLHALLGFKQRASRIQ